MFVHCWYEKWIMVSHGIEVKKSKVKLFHIDSIELAFIGSSLVIILCDLMRFKGYISI